jgi:hypothetical protein
MTGSTLLTGLYAAGLLAAAVVALVFAVVALLGAAAFAPLTHPHEPAAPQAGPRH